MSLQQRIAALAQAIGADIKELQQASTPSAFFSLVTVTAASAGQTSFTIPGGYTPGAVVVFLDGASLAPAHYTASSGTAVVLQSGTDVVAGTELVLLRLSTFQVADALPLGGTAADSSKLGGQLPEYYAAASTVPAGANLLINGDFAINQRGFAGGALAAGAYGHDRWGAYNGGANYSVSGGVVTLNSGTLCQVVESANLAGRQVTLSVEDLSGSLSVVIGDGTGSSSASATITPGAGRRGATLTVPASIQGHLKVRLSGAVSFRRVKLERGASPTAFSLDPAIEILKASRYCYQLGYTASFAYVGQAFNSTTAYVFVPAFMRAAPSAVRVRGVWTTAGNNPGSVSQVFLLGPGIVRLTLTASGLIAGQAVGVSVDDFSYLDAELPCTD